MGSSFLRGGLEQWGYRQPGGISFEAIYLSVLVSHASVLPFFTQEKHTKLFHKTIKGEMIAQHFRKIYQQMKIADLLEEGVRQLRRWVFDKSSELPDKHFVGEISLYFPCQN